LKSLIPIQICHFWASKCSHSWPNLGKPCGHFGFQKAATSWGLDFGAHKTAKISQHKVNFSPDSLKSLIPIQICHFGASKCYPSWPNLSQSWGHFGFQKAATSWGLAPGAHKTAKISQHKVNFSPDSLKSLIPIQICHFWASKCSHSWPNLGKPCGHFGFQNVGFSLGISSWSLQASQDIRT